MDQPNLALFHTVELIGFYFTPLVVWGAVALIPFVVLRWALGRIGFYRFVWNRSLFNTALYVLITGGIVYFGNLAWL